VNDILGLKLICFSNLFLRKAPHEISQIMLLFGFGVKYIYVATDLLSLFYKLVILKKKSGCTTQQTCMEMVVY
jgi:hypothetical protein